nr:uncharacterized protein LOC110641388 [Ipomoea trifida]GLL21584.1 uncharacterized protein LOC110641388 [Ipomoea trifida]GMC77969.1 ribonuclease H [Ipomoea batatas]
MVIRRVILEIDSHFKERSVGANGNSSLLASLLQLLDLYREVLIQHAYRESNFSADWLASFAASLPPILHDPPPGVLEWLYHDKVGLSYPNKDGS